MDRDGTIAALGEASWVRGFALAGARVIEAEDAEAARSAWRALPGDVAVVILTPQAARAIGDAAYEPGAALTVISEPISGSAEAKRP